MRDVHLYLVKLFGCVIVEEMVTQIDITQFAHAILNNCIHPNVYAAFGPTPADELENGVIASRSDLQMNVMKDGRCAFAAWSHHVGSLSVRVMYALDGEQRQGLVGAWNPKFGTTRLQMDGF